MGPEHGPTSRDVPTDKGRERSEQLLDAGLAAIARRRSRDLLPSRAETLRASESDTRGIGPASSGSFRNAFGSLDEFHRRLVAERLLTTHPAVPETVALLNDAVEALATGRSMNLAHLVAGIARHNLEANLSRPADERARLACFVAALAPDGDEVAEALRADYDDFTGQFAELYEQVLEGWGRRLRAPFDPRSVAVVLGALADGLTLRHLVDPDAVDIDDFQHVVVVLCLLLVAPADDERGIEQLIEAVFPQPPPSTAEV